MANYPEGSYVKDGGLYRKVLGQAGSMRFLSAAWRREGWSAEDEALYSLGASIDWLPRLGYTEASPEEATGRKEKWVPDINEKYWFPSVLLTESVESKWEQDDFDKERIGTFGVFKTKEESDARLKRILEAIKNIE